MFAVASARSLHSIESKRASLATAPPPPPPVYDDECCHNNPCCKHPHVDPLEVHVAAFALSELFADDIKHVTVSVTES
ncbi:hypothetical protein LguiB_004269 [Lonicera macranthoides]